MQQQKTVLAKYNTFFKQKYELANDNCSVAFRARKKIVQHSFLEKEVLFQAQI